MDWLTVPSRKRGCILLGRIRAQRNLHSHVQLRRIASVLTGSEKTKRTLKAHRGMEDGGGNPLIWNSQKIRWWKRAGFLRPKRNKGQHCEACWQEKKTLETGGHAHGLPITGARGYVGKALLISERKSGLGPSP